MQSVLLSVYEITSCGKVNSFVLMCKIMDVYFKTNNTAQHSVSLKVRHRRIWARPSVKCFKNPLKGDQDPEVIEICAVYY